MITTVVAQAYVNHGRWVADCPYQYCGNAVALEPKQTTFHCMGGCQLITELRWPPDAEDITEALAARPFPLTRNWAPAGHRQAIATGFPDGQTVVDLVAETREHLEI